MSISQEVPNGRAKGHKVRQWRRLSKTFGNSSQRSLIAFVVQRQENVQDIKRKATYISNLNQFLAERQLSAADLILP